MASVLEKGYSAHISGQLLVNGNAFQLAQVGPDICIVRDPTPVPPGEARIVVSIDGYDDTYRVFLTDGVCNESEEVRFRVI